VKHFVFLPPVGMKDFYALPVVLEVKAEFANRRTWASALAPIADAYRARLKSPLSAKKET